MQTDQLTYAGNLVVHTCWCGIRHAIPSELDHHIRQDRKNVVYCPLGHRGVVRKSDVAIEREKRERAETDATFWRGRYHEQAEETEFERRRAAALKGHLTRLRKRVANGVCPVAGCKRSFENVHRHLETEHASWLAEHPEVVDA